MVPRKKCKVLVQKEHGGVGWGYIQSIELYARPS